MYLRLLGLRSHNEQLSSRVDDLDLAYDGRCVRGDEEPAQVVDEKFVAACSISRVST